MNAPGCFGAASVFAHDSLICQSCPAFSECSALSLQRLQAISEVVNVTDLLRKHEKAQLAMGRERAQRYQSDEVKQTRVIERAKPIAPIQRKTTVEKVSFDIDPITYSAIAAISNKKASAQAVTLCKGVTITQIRRDLSAGVNSMPVSPRWLHIVGSMLVAGSPPLSRAALKSELMNQLQWSEGTAASHVAIASALVLGLGIAVEEQGSLVLAPDQTQHNQ